MNSLRNIHNSQLSYQRNMSHKLFLEEGEEEERMEPPPPKVVNAAALCDGDDEEYDVVEDEDPPARDENDSVAKRPRLDTGDACLVASPRVVMEAIVSDDDEDDDDVLEDEAPSIAKGGVKSGAKRSTVQAEDAFFPSPPAPAGSQIMLPLRLTRKAHMLPANTPAVQVQYENISATLCAPRVWAALTRRLRTLLCGSSARSNKRPRSGNRHSLVANVVPVDAGSLHGLEIIKTAYGSAQNSDYRGVDTSHMLLFKVSWPNEETYPSTADCAHILLDETGEGAGVAMIYGRAAMYFQGPAEQVNAAAAYSDDDSDTPILRRKTTIGEMRGFTPMAACVLRMLCDIICRVSWGSKQRMADRVCMRVLLNTPANDHVVDMYRHECKSFSETVMQVLFTVSTKSKKTPEVTGVSQRVAAPVFAAPSAVAAPAAAFVSPATVFTAQSVSAPIYFLPVAALASLCDTIRRKNLASETVDARVVFWSKVAKVQLPIAIMPGTYGTPGYSHALENALARMATAIAHLSWDEDMINMAESQMSMMMGVRL